MGGVAMSILDRFRVDGQVAIVTGAGRGIGAATAVALAEAGADVVVSARTAEQIEEVAETIRGLGRRAAVVPADLSDTANLGRLVEVASDELGRVDIVVNNVGGTMPLPLMDTTDKFLEEALHFNVTTALALTRAAVPVMLKTGGGSIVSISSVMGRVTGRGYLAYGTAKAALAHMTRLMAADLSPRIRANAIAVGAVATSALDIVMSNDELRTQMESATPLGRIGEPEEIAAGVLYLCSPAGAFITGKILEIDGGTETPTLDFGLPDLSTQGMDS
jgi:7-alpha-hydroxysteroid dehydrogenase